MGKVNTPKILLLAAVLLQGCGEGPGQAEPVPLRLGEGGDYFPRVVRDHPSVDSGRRAADAERPPAAAPAESVPSTMTVPMRSNRSAAEPPAPTSPGTPAGVQDGGSVPPRPAVAARRSREGAGAPPTSPMEEAVSGEGDIAVAAVRDGRTPMREWAAFETERLRQGVVIRLTELSFPVGEAVIRPASDELLSRLAKLLHERPDQAIRLEGHSDDRGDEAFNQELSLRRAMALKHALVGRGVDPARIEVRGWGEVRPIASNESEEGRRLNRRVDVVLQPRSAAR